MATGSVSVFATDEKIGRCAGPASTASEAEVAGRTPSSASDLPDRLWRLQYLCSPLSCSLLDQSITRHFLSHVTDQQGKITAEYVWIGGTMQDLRSKSRTLTKIPKGPEVRLVP